MNYCVIKKNYQSIVGFRLHDQLLYLVSPFFTLLFLKLRVIPNMVTLFMIIFGVLGACFFAIPGSLFKIIGVIFIYLWYIMDCSDGEVARITKRFSLYGKEIDYTAHVIDHPLFTLAFMINLIDISYYYVFLIGSLGFLDTIYRHLCSFDIIKELKEGPFDNSSKVNSDDDMRFKLSRIPNIIFYNISSFPQFVLFFPIVLFLDIKLSIFYTSVVFLATLLKVLIGIKNWIVYILYK